MQRIIVSSPKTIEEVELMIHLQWETYDPDFLTKFTKSMKKRCDLVIASGGKRLITNSNNVKRNLYYFCTPYCELLQ